jgi:uncharacterized repeat protein (TIGR03803 family)
MRSNFLFSVALAGLSSFVSSAERAQAASYSVIHAFTGGSDGGGPVGGLIDVGGALYGTTAEGGNVKCYSPYGCGTVFKMTPGGIETVLHSFRNYEIDGFDPEGELTRVGSAFFGFASGADPDNQAYKEIFQVNPTGYLKVLYKFLFRYPNDGYFPNGPLIDVGGTLYGTTTQGGFYGTTKKGKECVGYGCGTVFQISPAGVEKVLYAFQGGTDGANPNAGLIDVDGTLYGTTGRGGRFDAGTVFKITTSGMKAVVYSFRGSDNSSSADGSYPNGLVDVGGTLYGTCTYGGAAGVGTVFKVTTAGIEKVLYSFRGGSDGSVPLGSLISVGGVLYGTTILGGQPDTCGQEGGCGTVIKVTKTGAETVMHAFAGGSDGSAPNGKLVNVGNTIFGTTQGGGGSGAGTVFQVTP